MGCVSKALSDAAAPMGTALDALCRPCNRCHKIIPLGFPLFYGLENPSKGGLAMAKDMPQMGCPVET